MTGPWFLETPEVTSTGIKEDRDKEKIYQTSGLFERVTFLLVPFGQKVVYAGNPADFEMLPTTVRRDSMVFVWAEVAL